MLAVQRGLEDCRASKKSFEEDVRASAGALEQCENSVESSRQENDKLHEELEKCRASPPALSEATCAEGYGTLASNGAANTELVAQHAEMKEFVRQFSQDMTAAV